MGQAVGWMGLAGLSICNMENLMLEGREGQGAATGEWQTTTTRTETASRALYCSENTHQANLSSDPMKGETIFNASQREFRTDPVIIGFSLDSVWII